MTDRRPDLEDQRLSDELATWFAGEVRQAELDLRRSRLRPARARGIAARSAAGPAVAAAVVVLMILAGVVRLPALTGPLAEPTGSSSPSSPSIPADPRPTASPEPEASPTSVPALGLRYRDGIPQVVGGIDVARQGLPLGPRIPVDDSSFLVGGWLLHVEATRQCLAGRSPLEPCGNPVLARTPLEDPSALPVVLGGTRLEEGPVVLRVHANDARAADCPEALVAACRSALVVEEVLWTDDEVSGTAPIGTIHVMRRLAALVPGLELTAVGNRIDPPIGEENSCSPGYPVQTWNTPGLEIAQILVFPTVAARDAVDDNFSASGWFGRRPDGTACGFMTDSFYSHTWVTGENVMVAVLTNASGASAAQQALVDRVAEALREP